MPVINPISLPPLVAKAAHFLLAALLGSGVIVWLVDHLGDKSGTVVLHVVESNVEVLVDDQTFQCGARDYTPLVVELSPGHHMMRMRRGDRVLCEEPFSLGRGEKMVLTAWEEPSHRVTGREGPPDVETTRPSGAPGRHSRAHRRKRGPARPQATDPVDSRAGQTSASTRAPSSREEDGARVPASS